MRRIWLIATFCFVGGTYFRNQNITITQYYINTAYSRAMAHLITGNKFDPNKDIPDLSGKVRLLEIFPHEVLDPCANTVTLY